MLTNALLSSPEYVVSECAKFETAFKKIIIKTENTAKIKEILEAYEKSIAAMEEHVQALVEKKEKKSELKKISLGLAYMKKTYSNCSALI